MKANGINLNGDPTGSTAPKQATTPKQKTRNAIERPASAKKRKIARDSPAPSTKRELHPTAQGDACVHKSRMPPRLSQSEHFGITPGKQEPFNHGSQPAVFVPMGMAAPPTSATYIQRPLSGYAATMQGQRPSFLDYPHLAHVPAPHLPADMRVQPLFHQTQGYALENSFPFERSNPLTTSFDEYINQDYVFQRPGPRGTLQSLPSRSLQLNLPPQPQEIVPLHQQKKGPTPLEDRDPQPKEGVVVVD